MNYDKKQAEIDYFANKDKKKNIAVVGELEEEAERLSNISKEVAAKANNKNLAFYFAVLMDDMILKTYNTGALRKATDYWTSLLIQADKLSRQAFSADDLANYNSPSSDPATQYRRHHIKRLGNSLKKAGTRLKITQALGW